MGSVLLDHLVIVPNIAFESIYIKVLFFMHWFIFIMRRKAGGAIGKPWTRGKCFREHARMNVRCSVCCSTTNAKRSLLVLSLFLKECTNVLNSFGKWL